MSLTDTRAERAQQVATAPTRSRRRRRRAAVAALTSVALLVGWLLAHATYDPLEHGTGTFGFGVAGEGFTLSPQQEVTNAFGTELRVITPAVGSRLGIVFGLANSGRMDVEILDVGFPFPAYYLDQPESFMSTAPRGSGHPRVPLEPFVLPAGGNRDVGMTFRVKGCGGRPVARSAGGTVAAKVPVTWRWLGRTHVSQVPINFRGTIDGLPGCAS